MISLQGEHYISKVDVGDESWWFWCGEYPRGGSLAARMAQLGRLALEEAAEIGFQIARALDYIHSKGIAYLNVQPRNIFFRHPLTGQQRSIELVLTNFARAATADQQLPTEPVAQERLVYAAPERLRPLKTEADQPADNRPQDVYALGVLLHHMLAGAPPFTGDEADVERAILASESNPLLRLDVPVEVGDLISQTMRRDPALRPSIEHLLIELDKTVPPPREIRVSATAPGPVQAAADETTEATTRGVTSSATRSSTSQYVGAPGAQTDVTALSPPLGARVRAAWRRFTEALRRLRPGILSCPPPKLVEPADGAGLRGHVTFAWDWKGRLEENMAFELRLWKKGQSHDRAGELRQKPESDIDLDVLVPQLPGEGNECFWSVAVVREAPYGSLSREAEPRRFVCEEESPTTEETGAGT